MRVSIYQPTKSLAFCEYSIYDILLVYSVHSTVQCYLPYTTSRFDSVRRCVWKGSVEHVLYITGGTNSKFKFILKVTVFIKTEKSVLWSVFSTLFCLSCPIFVVMMTTLGVGMLVDACIDSSQLSHFKASQTICSIA